MRCTGKISLRFATAVFPVSLGVGRHIHELPELRPQLTSHASLACGSLACRRWSAPTSVLAGHTAFESTVVYVRRAGAAPICSWRRFVHLAVLASPRTGHFQSRFFVCSHRYCVASRSRRLRSKLVVVMAAHQVLAPSNPALNLAPFGRCAIKPRSAG